VLRRPFESAQYTAFAFGKRCDEAGVRPSMGSVGDCFDNAMCESFFATLECELIDRTSFKTQAEARMAVLDFIEGWYNPHRRHSSLNYLSPIAYERGYSMQPGSRRSDQPVKRHRAAAAGGGKNRRRTRRNQHQPNWTITESFTKPDTVY